MLVIFDCDGVLVDSEFLSSQVLSQELERIKVYVSPEKCLRIFRGKTLSECFEIIEREYKARLPKDFHEQIEHSTREAFASDLKAVKGIKKVLAQLQKRNSPMCVASNGGYDKLKFSLEVTGLLKFFGDHYYSADQVMQGKPAPDLFLYAAHQLGFESDQCAVIEDSEVGVQAAQAANMKVLHFMGGEPPGWEATILPRYRQFSSMDELPELLADLGYD